MSDIQFIILVLVLALATFLTRYLPFIVFNGKGQIPKFIEVLGNILPCLIMAFLVFYSFKDLDFTSFASVMPAIVASASVVGVQLWKKNTIVSILVGTVVYMILIRIA